MRTFWPFAALLLLASLAVPGNACAEANTAQTQAEPGRAAGPPVWQVEGERNRVYLLGSIHLLRETDYPLSQAALRAYADAEVLVMELDMDALDPAAAQGLFAELGLVSDGIGLRARIGEEVWPRASEAAAALGVDLAMLDNTEPWFAALTILNNVMLRQGFDQSLGIESFLGDLAANDGKPIEGLETLRFQLGIFDSLEPDMQREFLLQTLESGADLDAQIVPLMRAWREGDRAALAELLLENFADFPSLYTRLVVERNRNWLRKIDELLTRDQDYLLIVGALHLVGQDGLLAGLAGRGRCPRKMSAESTAARP